MEIKIATNIETNLFYSILKYLKKNKWTLVAEYKKEIYAKGIDFDLYQFEKKDQIITLVWNNWDEGEIKASSIVLKEIAKHFDITFKYSKSEYLFNSNLLNELGILIKYQNKGFFYKLKKIFNKYINY